MIMLNGFLTHRWPESFDSILGSSRQRDRLPQLTALRYECSALSAENFWVCKTASISRDDFLFFWHVIRALRCVKFSAVGFRTA